MNTALKTFGSSARVKIIRLFLSNPKIYSHWRMSPPRQGAYACRKTGDFSFKSVGLIKQRDETIDEIVKLKDGTEKIKRKNSTAIF